RAQPRGDPGVGAQADGPPPRSPVARRADGAEGGRAPRPADPVRGGRGRDAPRRAHLLPQRQRRVAGGRGAAAVFAFTLSKRRGPLTMTDPLHHPDETTSNAARDQAARYEPRALRTYTPTQAVLARSAGV